MSVSGLRQILTDVVEEVRRTLNQDIDGTEILHSLLNAPWLQSLLKVHAHTHLDTYSCASKSGLDLILAG